MIRTPPKILAAPPPQDVFDSFPKGLHFEEREPFLPEISCVINSETGMLVPGHTNCDNMPAFTSVLLPTSNSASIVHHFSREPKSQTKNWRSIFKNPTNIRSNYSKIYEGEMKKLKDSISNLNCYQGKITNFQKREINLNKDNILLNSANVSGSDDYYIRSRSDIRHGMNQAGPVFLVTELTIPYYSNAAFCTQLLVDNNFKVDISESDINVGETIYKVHMDHNNNEMCSDECEPVDLKDFLELNNKIGK